MKRKKITKLLRRLDVQTGIMLDRYAYDVPVVRRKGEAPKLIAGFRFGPFGVVNDGQHDSFPIYHLNTGALIMFANDLVEAGAICGALAMLNVDWATLTLELAEEMREDEDYKAGVKRVHQAMSAVRGAGVIVMLDNDRRLPC